MEYTQFIDGTLTAGSNRESWINYNPANNNPLGEVSRASDEDIEAAVDSSERAFQIWKTKCDSRLIMPVTGQAYKTADLPRNGL